MTGTELVVGLVILVGLVGVVVPLLPGTLLVAGAVVVWAFDERSTTAWACTAVALGLLAVGVVVKYAVPGKRLKSSGVPTSTLLLGGLLGIVGFFVVPVIGLFLGFVLGVYLAEVRRLGSQRAWPATRAALAAVGLSVLIELVAALLAAVVWLGGAVAT
ncbi:MAG: hypothetical protein AVDCRST_MAG24-1247 [uncultured Nocardioidaceae bacterium]|uniref:DUF456 domain-containing protein n=1 Tax=uncultured Nocardioidaceae bacterium TaxID=253824 RepID=A0A6J4LTA7_9ACTN|nr:MAG: hypothetical protein AVDCRST_MAG24-1247 [uncultured Nocardioidaceae bacterium]